RGILHIFRDQREFDRACASAEVMARAGLPQTVVAADALVQTEPALLSAAPELVGGILSPDDESGDAHAFTLAMARLAAEGGVVFRHGETVRGLDIENGRVTAVITDQGRRTADAYILSLGSWSPLVARDAGLRLPIYPAKGYSITIPISGLAPHVSITDDEHKMVYSRLGDRLRAAGTAELAGWDRTLNPARAALILNYAKALFPEAGDYAQAELWCGLRPKTPDSVPYVGPTPLPNLWLNTGHGTLGWTMAVGSARIITDLIGGRTPDIDISGFGLKR
ncbi:MAG: FAD-dependent oxidoreductase, partial [Rhodospirillaceae bacterium]